MKFGFDWSSGFRGKIFEIVDADDNDGRTTEHGHPISSPFEPSAIR